MICPNCNFKEFIKSIKINDYMKAVYKTDQEATGISDFGLACKIKYLGEKNV
jgi:hypothetical protein